jgi:predicted nucleic acid-binding protein
VSYLLDTHVVSELRKGPRCDAGVAAWLVRVSDEELFVSVLVLGEIRRGIEGLRRKDARQARAIERWLDGLTETFAERVLAVTPQVAAEWGRLSAERPLPTIDGLLAATAHVHGLTLVSRDLRGVARTGVAILNPFAARAG